MSRNPPIRIEAPNATASNAATIIFLHGFGDDADGWTDIASQFHAANRLTHLTFIFPNAPYSQDAGTTAWYQVPEISPIPTGKRSSSPLSDTEADSDTDQDGILKSVEYACSLVDEEVAKGVNGKRIVLGGFSQGCAVSLVAGLGSRYADKIAGIVGLSGYLPWGKKIESEVKSVANGDGARGDMKVFLAHGTKDMLIPMRMFREGMERVKGLVGEGNLTVQTYEGMGHVTCGAELRAVCEFLEKIVPA